MGWRCNTIPTFFILLHFQIDSFVVIYLTRHICETAFLEHQHIVRCDFCCVLAVLVGYGNYLCIAGGVDFYMFNGSGLHVAYYTRNVDEFTVDLRFGNIDSFFGFLCCHIANIYCVA